MDETYFSHKPTLPERLEEDWDKVRKDAGFGRVLPFLVPWIKSKR